MLAFVIIADVVLGTVFVLVIVVVLADVVVDVVVDVVFVLVIVVIIGDGVVDVVVVVMVIPPLFGGQMSSSDET